MKYEKCQRYSKEESLPDFSTKNATFFQGGINDIEVLLHSLTKHSLRHFFVSYMLLTALIHP